MASLQLSHVWKRFADTIALRDLSFDVEDGEFFVFFGPAGAGKTTTLKMIAGLERPTAGEIYIGGEPVNDIADCNRNVAMAFENYSLFPHLSVYDNLANPLRAPNCRMPESDIKVRVAQIAEMLSISPLLDRKPHQLSGGQKQRTALGRAMVKDARLLLLDEPLAHVDAKIRNELRIEFHRLEALKMRTIVYVTHDYVDALSLADRIGIIHRGTLHTVDTPKNIYQQPIDIFTAKSVGQPEINLIDCNVQNINGETLLVEPESQIRFYPTPQDCNRLNKRNSEKVILGFRGQYAKPAQDNSISKNVIPGSVEVFLPLGAYGQLTVRNSDKIYNVMVDPDAKYQHKDPIRLQLDEKQFLFFDPSSQMNIYYLQ